MPVELGALEIPISTPGAEVANTQLASLDSTGRGVAGGLIHAEFSAGRFTRSLTYMGLAMGGVHGRMAAILSQLALFTAGDYALAAVAAIGAIGLAWKAVADRTGEATEKQAQYIKTLLERQQKEHPELEAMAIKAAGEAETARLDAAIAQRQADLSYRIASGKANKSILDTDQQLLDLAAQRAKVQEGILLILRDEVKVNEELGQTYYLLPPLAEQLGSPEFVKALADAYRNASLRAFDLLSQVQLPTGEWKGMPFVADEAQIGIASDEMVKNLAKSLTARSHQMGEEIKVWAKKSVSEPLTMEVTASFRQLGITAAGEFGAGLVEGGLNLKSFLKSFLGSAVRLGFELLAASVFHVPAPVFPMLDLGGIQVPAPVIPGAAPMNVTVIGPDDPAAQRAVARLVRNAGLRGIG